MNQNIPAKTALRLLPHFRVGPLLAGTFFLFAAALPAQVPVPAPATNNSAAAGQDPLNRTTPQRTVLHFLEQCHAGNYQRASQYMDLTRSESGEGPGLAQELCRVLDRDAKFDVAGLSLDPEGDLDDDLPPDREAIASYDVAGKTLNLRMVRMDLGSGVPVWIFTAETVRNIPRISALFGDSPVEKYLPSVLVDWRLMETPLWRWIALVLLAIAIAAISRRVSQVAIAILRPAWRRLIPGATEYPLAALLRPLQILLAVALFRAGVEWAAPSALTRLYLGRLMVLGTIAGLVWLAVNLVDFGIGRVRYVMQTTTFSRSALPMIGRVIKALILVFGFTLVLGSWGYNTSTILAGLGIGGIAVALAAQKTIENLFGGVAVISDQPVIVGDFCRFGDRVGTVEDIGLRSTKIRTLDRTLVTIPNGEFSSMTLENFSRRDKMWFHPKISLRRDTTPDQVRKIMAGLERLLRNSENVEVGGLPLRFTGVGDYSLDIEIFAYVLTADYDEYLRIQGDLLLQILDLVEESGAGLALPTTAYLPLSGGANLPVTSR